MLLILFIGAVFIYLALFMAFIVALMGVGIAISVYALSYIVMYTVARLRHRSSPEWKFEGKVWTPDLELVQAYSVVAGFLTLAGMIISVLIFAISGSWSTALWITGGILAYVVISMYIHRDEITGDEHPSTPVKTFDRDKYSQ